jgi:hypothetical protein
MDFGDCCGSTLEGSLPLTEGSGSLLYANGRTREPLTLNRKGYTSNVVLVLP